MRQSESIEVRRLLEMLRKDPNERLDDTLKRLLEHTRELEAALGWRGRAMRVP